MCLILLALRTVPQRPWLLLGNRDEYHARPTLPAAPWTDDAKVIGGRDLEAGGSWLAVARGGRFATVTNVRAGPPRRGKRSRGAIVADFVRGHASPLDYANEIARTRDEFGPFNLIVGDAHAAFGASSLSSDAWRFDDGVHVLSNGPPIPMWPKAERLRDNFQKSIQGGLDDSALLDLLVDTTQPADHELPETGVGIDLERLLAPIFIAGENYGTRASTLAYLRDDGSSVLCERRFGPNGVRDGESRVEI